MKKADAGPLVDDLVRRRIERLRLQDEINAMKRAEENIERALITILGAGGMARGITHEVEVVPKVKYEIKHWFKFWRFCRRTKDGDRFIEQRCTQSALKEFGRAAPGIVAEPYNDLSIRKI